MSILVQEIDSEVIANHFQEYEDKQISMANKILERGVLNIDDFFDKVSTNVPEITLASDTLTDIYDEWVMNNPVGWWDEQGEFVED